MNVKKRMKYAAVITLVILALWYLEVPIPVVGLICSALGFEMNERYFHE